MIKTAIKLFVLLTSLSFVSASALAATNCFDTASSQDAMNQCAGAQLLATEAQLNALKKKIQQRYQNDPIFLKSFAQEEKMWEQYRDALVKMKYPRSPQDPTISGSVFPMCYALYLNSLIDEHLRTLKPWAEDQPDGDVCTGSVKEK